MTVKTNQNTQKIQTLKTKHLKGLIILSRLASWLKKRADKLGFVLFKVIFFGFHHHGFQHHLGEYHWLTFFHSHRVELNKSKWSE